MNELYPALPGHRTEIRDRQLVLAPEPATTESILIIGTATDGPVMSPVSIRNIEDAKKFGKSVDHLGNENGATLLKGIYEAWAGGCRDVRAMRISGEKAKATLIGEDFTEEKRVAIEDFLGVGVGNTLTTITLNKINPSTDKIVDIDVVVNGKALSKNAFELSNNIVTIFAGVTDGLADVTVFYTFEKDTLVNLVEEPMVAVDASFKTFRDAKNRILWDQDDAESFEFRVEGYGALDSSAYEVDWENATVTITDESIEVDSDIDVTYSATIIEKVVFTPNDKDQDGNAYGTHPLPIEDAILTNADNQSFELSSQPIYSSFKLYANGYLIEPNGYFLNATEKKVTLKPGAVRRGATVVARYITANEEVIKSSLTLESVSAGSVYNDISIQVLPYLHENGMDTGEKIIRIMKPESKKENNYEEPIELNTLNYKNLESLVTAINGHYNNNIVVASTLQPKAESKHLRETGILYFSGGDDGLDLTLEEMYDKLGGEKDEYGNITVFGAYDMLEHYSVDYVIPQGVYADQPADPRGDKCFAQQLAQFCAVASMRNKQVEGWISTTPPKSFSLQDLYQKAHDLVKRRKDGRFVFHMKNLRGDVMLDDEGEPIDSGKYLRIVAMTDGIMSSHELGVYRTNAMNAIAGYISTLPIDHGPTNKSLYAMGALSYTLSNDQLNMLTDSHFITTSRKYRDGVNQIYIVDGPTMAEKRSDYTRITSMRALKAVTNLVRDISDPYIGNGYAAAEQASHTTEIQVALDDLVEANIIQDFKFNIHASIQDQVLGNAIIELEFVPKFELRNLKTLVNLRPSL